MLDELLSNALKYRRKRPVILHAARSGKTLSISVTNNGPWLGPKPAYKRFRRGESRRALQASAWDCGSRVAWPRPTAADFRPALTRVFTFLHQARPVLLNLSTPCAL